MSPFLNQITTVGFFPVWPTTIPLQDTLQLIDSLLASPVWAVVFDRQEPDVIAEAIHELYTRGGNYLLVGVVAEERMMRFQLISQGEDDVERVDVPIVESVEQVLQAVSAGHEVIVSRTADLDKFRQIVHCAPQVTWLVWGAIHVNAVPLWQRVGLKGLIAPVWLSDEQLMQIQLRGSASINAVLGGQGF